MVAAWKQLHQRGTKLDSQSPFQRLTPDVADNVRLRDPQREAYGVLSEYFSDPEKHREAGVVLPVGCGKSGLITLAPFAARARKVLVIAPGLRIAGQLLADFNPTNQAMFYRKCSLLPGSEYPEPAEIRGKSTNRSDLDEADVVVTNIQQLQRGGADNRWLADLPEDYFDLIIFDEGHHNVAESWDVLRAKFPAARIISMSATPTRADGRLMAGEIIYTYPIYRAVQKGFVKHIKGLVLNPSSLRYARREDSQEVEVDLDEVRRLGAEDAGFRRSIVSSRESLATIVDASITELRRLREATGEPRLKIIASALNMEHSKQIVAAYRERGMRASHIHSLEDSKSNDQVLAQLDRHELDVIVQVRMLGEGFDHPYLSVAAVFSIFATLSPFVQFVGRIMRVIEHNAPGHPLNEGSVVFHAGANTIKAWDDFKVFAEADQEWFKLLTEQVPVDGKPRVVDPTEDMERREPEPDPVHITEPGAVSLEELPLLSDERLREALATLKQAGVTPEEYGRATDQLQPIPVTKQARRQASRLLLDETIKTRAGRLVKDHGLNHEGRDLDTRRLGRGNWLVVKAAVDSHAAATVGRSTSERDQYSQAEIDLILERLDSIVASVESELFNGRS
jgi:superfamily II DNA or RNA helicase